MDLNSVFRGLVFESLQKSHCLQAQKGSLNSHCILVNLRNLQQALQSEHQNQNYSVVDINGLSLVSSRSHHWEDREMWNDDLSCYVKCQMIPQPLI